MRYCVDASSMIDAWRKWYSPATHPSLWPKVEHLVHAHEMCISDQVLEDLSRIDDELFRWCKDHEGDLCIPSDGTVQQVLRQIQNTYPNLGTLIPGKKNYSDPYVVAVGKLLEANVVTHESPTGNLNGPRIPDVCKAEGIRVMQFYHVLRDEGWAF